MMSCDGVTEPRLGSWGAGGLCESVPQSTLDFEGCPPVYLLLPLFSLLLPYPLPPPPLSSFSP